MCLADTSGSVGVKGQKLTSTLAQVSMQRSALSNSRYYLYLISKLLLLPLEFLFRVRFLV